MPDTPDHAFKDEWTFQRSMSKGNPMAGKPIAATQPCFSCGVVFAEHGGSPAGLGVERLAKATARVVGWSGPLDYHRDWAAEYARLAEEPHDA
jgi:hypothetical protein